MRSRLALVAAVTVCAVAFAIPTPAHAQGTPGADSASFLVSGMTQAPPPSGGGGGGVGFGIKGGWLYSSFSQAGESLDNKGGWEAGVFFGGNRSGVVGVMGEVLYARKSYREGVATKRTIDLDYIEIPILVRINLGSANKNAGVIVYLLGGPVFDINVKAQQEGVDVTDNYERMNFGLLGGGGLEISRIIFEGRYNWGLQNILKNSGAFSSELKNQSFALLVGLRFN